MPTAVEPDSGRRFRFAAPTGLRVSRCGHWSTSRRSQSSSCNVIFGCVIRFVGPSGGCRRGYSAGDGPGSCRWVHRAPDKRVPRGRLHLQERAREITARSAAWSSSTCSRTLTMTQESSRKLASSRNSGERTSHTKACRFVVVRVALFETLDAFRFDVHCDDCFAIQQRASEISDAAANFEDSRSQFLPDQAALPGEVILRFAH